MKINVVALRTLRELAGLSQAELSRRSGISQGHISNIESGMKEPRPATIRRFATVIGVPVAALISTADRSTETSAAAEGPSPSPRWEEVVHRIAAAIDDVAYFETDEPLRLAL